MDIDRVPREVIDAKLLAALDDDDKVALVLSEADLDLMIGFMGRSDRESYHDDDDRERLTYLYEGMLKLRHEAFG